MAKIKKKSGATAVQAEEEIRSIAHTAAEAYRANRNQYNAVLTILAVVIAVLITTTLVSANKEKQAGLMLDSAMQSLSAAGAAPVNYPAAVQRLKDVVQQYGGTQSAAIAQYAIGNAFAASGQYDQALQEYDRLVKAGKATFLLPFVYQRLGYAYLALGRQEDAVKAFGKAEEAGGPGPATLELARIYDRSGNTVEAQKKYKEVAERLSATSWAVEARTKLPPPNLTVPPAARPAGK